MAGKAICLPMLSESLLSISASRRYIQAYNFYNCYTFSLVLSLQITAKLSAGSKSARAEPTGVSCLRYNLRYLMDIFMVVHLIDFHRFAVYEAGASLISVLAYPGDGDEELRAGVHASLCTMRSECGAKSSRIGHFRHSR